MRQIHSTPKEGKPPRAKREEPLEEGLLPPSRREPIQWEKMAGDELVRFAKEFMLRNKIASRSELAKAYPALYNVLHKRSLMGGVIASKRRDWETMPDPELITHARTFVKENRLASRTELEGSDSGLHYVLAKRGLLDRVLGVKHRRWPSMTDDEVSAYAKTFIRENKITSIKELERADCGLYNVLQKRSLVRDVLPSKLRDWASMPDQEVLGNARDFIKENGITSRDELHKADCGLYNVLKTRRLLGSVLGLKRRDWPSMCDQELVSHVKTFLKGNEITSRTELQKADNGMYQVLNKRGLMDAVFSESEAQTRTEAVDIILAVLDRMEGSR